MGSLTSTRQICTLTVSGAGGALASMANQRWAHFLLRNQTNHRRLEIINGFQPNRRFDCTVG
ncbi:hypothetical protein T4D_897 [Trichinella pseudospiralis]|uniref:Uncharacterized protein n=1 Tax=Trichinella pseudospiralis TaxID=6337 RepID=A0A0V1FRN2_TRIPS|nr:hypothetical protein T4D_897 [Trichinella pseudospiralis]